MNKQKFPTLKEAYFSEISKQSSENYFTDIKNRRPELYKQLKIMAALVLRLMRQGKTPTESVKALRIYLNKHKDLDPIFSGDTLGLKMFMQNMTDDRKEAARVKRYYDDIFNALLKKRYEK